MGGKDTLSPQSIDLIKALLKEPKIMNRIIADFPKAQEYHSVLINSATGSMSFGKYNWSSWTGCFWNNLIKCYVSISFSDFAIKVWDALVDMTAGNEVIQEAVLKGLSREVLMRGIRNKEYDWIINRFIDIARHLTDKGYWAEHGHKVKAPTIQQPVLIQQPEKPVQVVVSQRSPSEQHRTLRVIDSVGDTFEILKARWVGGME